MSDASSSNDSERVKQFAETLKRVQATFGTGSSQYSSGVAKFLSIMGEAPKPRQFTWAIVRTVGELELLTRASFVLLIVVPVLANLWPTIRHTIQYYNEAAAAYDAKLEAVVTQIGDAEESLRDFTETAPAFLLPAAERMRRATMTLEEEAVTLTEKVALPQVVSPALPTGWFLAFYAAILALLGKACYQVFASEVVKNFTRDAFVAQRLRMYSDSPVLGMVSHADAKITEAKKCKMPVPDSSYFLFKQGVRRATAKSKAAAVVEVAGEGDPLEIVWKGSYVEYDLESVLRMKCCVVAAALYGTAIALLLAVIVLQCVVVYQAWIADTGLIVHGERL